MKNTLVILLGAFGLMATGLTYAIYRKDKEIEENCGCKNPTPNNSLNSGMNGAVRMHERMVNSAASYGSGVGGGRSAGDMSSVQPRGRAIATFSTNNVTGVPVVDGLNSAASFNRMVEYSEKLSARNFAKSNPVVSAWGSKAIANSTAASSLN